MSASSIASESLRDVYREANEGHNVKLVRQLNEQGMKPIVPPFSGPTIISPFMDIATKYDIILNFFKELKASGHLLTEREFDHHELWKKKDDLTMIKVPQKHLISYHNELIPFGSLPLHSKSVFVISKRCEIDYNAPMTFNDEEQIEFAR